MVYEGHMYIHSHRHLTNATRSSQVLGMLLVMVRQNELFCVAILKSYPSRGWLKVARLGNSTGRGVDTGTRLPLPEVTLSG